MASAPREYVATFPAHVVRLSTSSIQFLNFHLDDPQTVHNVCNSLWQHWMTYFVRRSNYSRCTV